MLFEKIEMLALPSNCSMRFRAINASIAERSRPPIGGIIPRKAFKYGSVIEPIVDKIGLLQSRFGNQLKSTRMIKSKE